LRSSANQILQTALALRLSPGERFRLLRQPLPPGITSVIEMASGAPQALKDAAVELGESEAVVLEAARFYLEQMLFAAPDADAYRILGVPPQAEQDQIRLHHRLLQRWLHPDRALAGDASVFATRVNQAWSRLRTPALREEYDAALMGNGQAGVDVPAPSPAFARWSYEDDGAPRQGRRSRWLFAAALACSVVLAVLVARHEDAAPVGEWDETAATAETAASTPVSTDDSGEVGMLSDALADRASAPKPATQRPIPVAPADARKGAPQVAKEPSPAAPAPAAIRAAVTDARPRIQARSPVDPPQPRPAMSPLRVATAAVKQARTPEVAAPPPARAPASPSVPEPRRMAMTPPSPPPQAPLASPMAFQPKPQVAVPVMLATAGEAAPPAQAPAAAPPAPPRDGDPAVLLDRMRKAERRVAEVAAYLSASPGAAPLWNDVQAQTEADRLRRRLGVRDGAPLQLLAPNWQLRPTDASYSATYRCDRCGVGEGRLEVRLVWREGLWLVRDIEMGPSA
jgi:DnaJ-domain-containing protein 1